MHKFVILIAVATMLFMPSAAADETTVYFYNGSYTIEDVTELAQSAGANKTHVATKAASHKHGLWTPDKAVDLVSLEVHLLAYLNDTSPRTFWYDIPHGGPSGEIVANKSGLHEYTHTVEYAKRLNSGDTLWWYFELGDGNDTNVWYYPQGKVTPRILINYTPLTSPTVELTYLKNYTFTNRTTAFAIPLTVVATEGDSELLSYTIDYDDGVVETMNFTTAQKVDTNATKRLWHEYTDTGCYNVTVTATDVEGYMGSYTQEVCITVDQSAEDGSNDTVIVIGGGAVGLTGAALVGRRLLTG